MDRWMILGIGRRSEAGFSDVSMEFWLVLLDWWVWFVERRISKNAVLITFTTNVI